MAKEKMICAECGSEMNQHAFKIDYTASNARVDPDLGGVLEEVHSCPTCGITEVRVV